MLRKKPKTSLQTAENEKILSTSTKKCHMNGTFGALGYSSYTIHDRTAQEDVLGPCEVPGAGRVSSEQTHADCAKAVQVRGAER